MTLKIWRNLSGGIWEDAFQNWPGDTLPSASDDVEFTPASHNTYQVDVNAHETVQSITVDDSTVTLNVGGLSGALQFNTFNLGTGHLILNGGLEFGTVIADAGASFSSPNGFFTDIVWQGTLALTATIGQPQLLEVSGGLTLLNTAGTGSGELDLTGPESEIDFDTATLDGTTTDAGLQINVSNSSLSGSAVLGIEGGHALTIGSHAHLDLAGAGDVRIQGVGGGIIGTFINNGTITSEAGTVEIGVDTFTNNGTMSVGGSHMVISRALTGNGTVNLSAGAKLELDDAASGTIHFGPGAPTLKVSSVTLPAATLGGFAAGDVIELGLQAYNSLDTVTLLANNVLDIAPAGAGGGSDMFLQLAASDNFSGRGFFLTPGQGDTQIRVASTVSVATPGGIDLRWATLYSEFANSAIQPGGTSTQCTVTDASAGIKFVFTGTGFTYAGTSPVQFTGGTITGFQIQNTSSNVLATFAGLSFSATAFQSAVIAYASSANANGLNAIFLANSYLETGAAGIDKFQGGNLVDDYVGGVGNDVVDGGLGINTADYSHLASLGLVAIMHNGAGTVNKGGANGSDTLTNTLNIVGTTATDVFRIDSHEAVFGTGGFDYLIELTPNVNLLYGTNFTGISEFVSNTGTNTVDFTADPNFAYIYGSTGTDTLQLGVGGGYLFSGGGTLNVLIGGYTGTNFLVDSGPGTTTMIGGGQGAVNYYYVSGATNDTVQGNSDSFDVVSQLAASVNIALGGTNFTSVEEYIANSGTNSVSVVNTDSGFKYLYGGAGNDTLSTGSGGGYLFGEGGTNTLTGGGGTNVFIADGGAGVDTMNGGSGSNLFYIDANSIVHGAGTFNNVIELQQNASLTLGSAQLGTNVQQVIFNGGTNLADFHTATSQVFLYGAAGNDTLFGGSASDFLYGGLGINTFKFASGWGKDTIEDWTAGTSDIIDLTGLSSLGVHAITDLTQTITAGKDVITSSHTGTNSITLLGVGSALTASSFHFS